MGQELQPFGRTNRNRPEHVLGRLQGTFVAFYQRHGFEIIQTTYIQENHHLHSLFAQKITGDDYVPAGKHTFKIIKTTTCTLPIDGVGLVAQRGFTNPQKVPGRLIFVNEDYNAFAFEYSSRGTVVFVRRFLGDFILHTATEEALLQLSDNEESLYTKVVRQIAQTINTSLVHVPANLYEIGSARSVSKQAIDQLTEKVTDNSVTNEICAICLESVDGEESVTRIAQCKHIFHSECITTWLLRCNQCPMCKCKVEKKQTQI